VALWGFFIYKNIMIKYYKNFDLSPLKYINQFGEKCVEQWFDIVGFEGIYQVSNLCRIKSVDRKCISVKKNGDTFYRFIRGKIMGQTLEKDLYLRINLTDVDKKRDRFNAHRLLAIATIPNPSNKPHVNHLDGIKWNNVAWNLEWATESENTQHAVDTGLMISIKGERHGRSKLTEKQVLEIRKIGNTMLQREIAEIYNVHREAISNILSRKCWKHI